MRASSEESRHPTPAELPRRRHQLLLNSNQIVVTNIKIDLLESIIILNNLVLMVFSQDELGMKKHHTISYAKLTCLTSIESDWLLKWAKIPTIVGAS